MKNVAKEVTKRIADLKAGKAAELLSLQGKIDDSQKAVSQAEKDVNKAVDNTDLEAYSEAKKKVYESTAAVEMYTARYKQLQAKEFISEEESDTVFDSLNEYEQQLSAEYEKEVLPLLYKLQEINKAYKDNIFEAEQAMKLWEKDIHLNYRSKHTTYANGTNRSEYPVPVRPRPYMGCDLSERVYHFLAAEELVKK